MSKIIRKARDQLHSVRDDSLRRQLQAARSDSHKHWPSRRQTSNTPQHHGSATSPGFKFSDIDTDSMDWLETEPSTGEETRSSSTHETRRTEVIQTSDYYSSHSSPEDNSYLKGSFKKKIDDIATDCRLLEGDDHSVADGNVNVKTVIKSRESQSASLFDDGPDLDEDYFATDKRSETDLFTPLGLNPSENTLFDPSSSPELDSTKEKDRTLIAELSSNESTDIPVEDIETVDERGSGRRLVEDLFDGSDDATKQCASNPPGFQEIDCNNVTEQSKPPSSTSDTKLYPSPNAQDVSNVGILGTIQESIPDLVITSEPHPSSPSPPTTAEKHTTSHSKDEECRDETVCKDSGDNDELFMSATNKLLIMSANQSRKDKEDETTPDPLSNTPDPLSNTPDPLSNTPDPSSIQESLSSSPNIFSDVDSHPLLLVTEDEYHEAHFSDQPQTKPLNPQLFTPDPLVPQPNSVSQSSLLAPHAHSSPRTSPLLSKKTQSKPSPSSQMRLSRSGKVVPVVPPRPAIHNKRTVSAPDPDTMSLASTVSSVSAYSADEIFNRDNASWTDGDSIQSFESGYLSTTATRRSDVTTGVPLERIVESPSIEEHSPQPTTTTDQQSDSNSTKIVLSLVWLLLYLYYSLNPFVYLAGFLAGFLVFYVTIGSAFFWYVQHSEREKERRKAANKRVELPTLEELPKSIDTNFESSRILKSKKFGMVYQYYPATHHPSQRVPAKVRLYDDFMLEICYKNTVHTSEGVQSKMVKVVKDLRDCSVLIVPEEIAQNRKRRWSKKFPVSISWSKDEADKKGRVFIFPYTSREKEEWFRRMRFAQEGKSYDQIVSELKIFVRYMGKYMPHAVSPHLDHSNPSSHSKSSKRVEERLGHRQMRKGNKHSSKMTSGSVHFSMTSDIADEEDDTTVCISSNSPKSSPVMQRNSLENLTPRNGEKHLPKSLLDPSVSPSLTYGWINAGMARLAWDIWHEERWKKWVQSRIQRKLIRIKTPSFMEPLKVTAIDMGMDMPVIKRPSRLPKLDSKGIWVYLEVDYKGTFNMTIETKLKLEPKAFSGIMHFNSGGHSPSLASSSQSHSPSPSPTPSSDDQMMMPVKHHHHHHRSRVSRFRVNATDEEEELSSGSSDDEEGGASHLTRSLEEKLPVELEQQGIPAYSKDDSNISPSSSSSSISSSSQFDDPNRTMGPRGRKEKILTNMISRLQKMAAKSKLVAKAAEKVSSYPMILSVEVKSLSGSLVVNMAPPPSDALWYGFTKNPVLDLVAKPKLGQREVTLSYVTDWIEKKLCEVVEKKLVYPNMEDLVIPILSSGLPEDKLTDLITSPS